MTFRKCYKIFLFLIGEKLTKIKLIHMCMFMFYIPGDQEGLFKLAVQLRTFSNSVIYNTATGYVLLVYLTNI
jgi:hypothetical protein